MCSLCSIEHIELITIVPNCKFVFFLKIKYCTSHHFFNMQYVKMVAGNFKDIYYFSSVQVVHLFTYLIYLSFHS
jgi:hypothetical protein